MRVWGVNRENICHTNPVDECIEIALLRGFPQASKTVEIILQFALDLAGIVEHFRALFYRISRPIELFFPDMR